MCKMTWKRLVNTVVFNQHDWVLDKNKLVLIIDDTFKAFTLCFVCFKDIFSLRKKKKKLSKTGFYPFTEDETKTGAAKVSHQ